MLAQLYYNIQNDQTQALRVLLSWGYFECGEFVIETAIILVFIVLILITVAMLTLFERKVLAAMQLRVGPNKVGPIGIFQPIADGLKLVLKEFVIPFKADKSMLIIAPLFFLNLAVLNFLFVPFNNNASIINSEFSALWLLTISSLSVYGIIMAGWASNSRYAFIGALRSTAQLISYEVCIGLSILPIFICSSSLNIQDIVLFQNKVYFIIPFFPLAIVFFIATLAETNRHPFDLPEAEGELVAGYNVELSAVGFAMFFIAEYANMILASFVMSNYFLGGFFKGR